MQRCEVQGGKVQGAWCMVQGASCKLHGACVLVWLYGKFVFNVYSLNSNGFHSLKPGEKDSKTPPKYGPEWSHTHPKSPLRIFGKTRRIDYS